MINKTLFAALLAATTLAPGMSFAAEADTKASSDQTTTGKAATDKVGKVIVR